MPARKEFLTANGLQKKGLSAARRYAKQWERWSNNFDTRKQLLKLEQHELNDIGVSREHALIEGKKPFWKD